MTRRLSYEGVAVAVPVTVPYVRYSTRSAHWFLGQAIESLVKASGVKKEQIDGSEDRDVKLKVGPNEMTFKGQQFLVNFSLPNFYFHVVTAYDILRHNGVEIGKRDFIGGI